MPTLDQHQSSEYTKLIYIGDSGTGKTGSLVSLLAAGYHLRILDLDNGLDALVHFAREQCPDKLKNVEYETIRDKYVSSRAGPICRSSKAFTEALDVLTRWADIEDPNSIAIVDSGSAFGRAGFEWAKGMNPAAKDPRQWYFAAQSAFENTIALLTSEAFKQNVIFISHVNYKEITEGVTKGHANAIGSALGPIIPRYFNTMILAETTGAGKNTKRRIKTMSTGIIDLKNPTPGKIENDLPLETGMAEIFRKLKGLE